MKRIRRYGWLALIIFLLLAAAVGGFVIWASAVSAPMPEALAALQLDDKVTVESGKWLIFRPTQQNPTTGLIFYPGGKVDYRAYAPAMHAIAAEGYLVVIVPMPLNLAVLAPNRAADVIAAFPSIEHWALGGHSLGGSMAAHFAYAHRGTVQGLVLWASYPAANESLATQGLNVVSISGSRDGLATPDKVAASRPLLPPDTRWVIIAGGDHAQMGWYGPQAGDNPATISRADQQQQVVAATLDLLRSLAAP